MHFIWPEVLWLMLLIPLLVVGYIWALRRKRTVAVHYPSLDLIRPALGPGHRIRRHIPPALLLCAFSLVLLGAARPSARVTLPADYLTLVTTLLLAFGLCFQLPVVVSLLGMAGLVNSNMLREGRRYAIVAVFVVAALFTPPDPISQLMLAIPICLLYEASIWCVWLIERRRKKQDEAAGTDIVPV